MIKTFIIDLPVLLLFGLVFAFFSQKDKTHSDFFRQKAFWQGIVFSSLFNVAVLYAAIYFPDWMWMYFPENTIRNTATELIFIFVFLYYLPYVAGFLLGQALMVRFKKAYVVTLAIALGAEVWLVIHLFDRYSVIGSRADFLAGTATSLFSPQNPIGPVMNGSIGLMLIYLGWVIFRYKKV